MQLLGTSRCRDHTSAFISTRFNSWGIWWNSGKVWLRLNSLYLVYFFHLIISPHECSLGIPWMLCSAFFRHIGCIKWFLIWFMSMAFLDASLTNNWFSFYCLVVALISFFPQQQGMFHNLYLSFVGHLFTPFTILLLQHNKTKLRKAAQQEILNEQWWRNVWVPRSWFKDPKRKEPEHNNNDRNAVKVIVSANPSHLQDHNFECYGCYGNVMYTMLKYSYWGLVWWLWPFPLAWNAVRFTQ